MFAVNPVTVVVVPNPVVVTEPGLRVRVHSPEAGNPVSSILPVVTLQVGWVTVPITGAEGVTGCGFIVTEVLVEEVQPSAFLTEKVYVPGGMPETVLVVPVPVVV